jgi:Ca2+-binding RTX toxin-like protein
MTVSNPANPANPAWFSLTPQEPYGPPTPFAFNGTVDLTPNYFFGGLRANFSTALLSSVSDNVTVIVSGTTPVAIWASYGNDVVTLGGLTQGVIYGGDGNDTLTGGAVACKVFGDAGDDLLRSGPDPYPGTGITAIAPQHLYGGSGWDRFEIQGGRPNVAIMDATAGEVIRVGFSSRVYLGNISYQPVLNFEVHGSGNIKIEASPIIRGATSSVLYIQKEAAFQWSLNQRDNYNGSIVDSTLARWSADQQNFSL